MLNTFFGYLFGLGLLTIALYLFVFAILEKKWAAEPGQPLSAYFLNIRITILYAIASSFFSGVSAGAIAKAGTSLGLGLIDLRFYPGNTILQVIVGIFIVAITDFFYYWFHRLQHMIPALWAQHKVHHLDEYLNASTANRHHWLEELLRIPFLAVPLAVLFKFDPMPAGIIGILFTAWGYFIHANLRFELGHVSRVLGGPQAHRIHHSRLEEHYNKNFAPFIPIWDIIFRTYHHPKSGEFPPTGIVGEKVSSMTHAALLPILVWLKTCFKTWNTSVKDHCEHLDIRFLFIIGISLTLSTIIYFMIPEQQSLLKIFSPEHTALYGFVDSFPQRISYIIFLCLIIVSVFILKLTPISNKSITVGKFWPVLSILLFLALLLNLRIFEFTFQSQMIILLTILIAYTAFKPKLNWIAWFSMCILFICAMLPGFLHTPIPLVTGLKDFDQHYNTVLYQGRYLSEGHLFSLENPPFYSMLWSTLIGFYTKVIQTPSFSGLVRFVQIGQLLFLSLFYLAAFLITKQKKIHVAVAMTFLSVSLIPWLSTDGFAIWFPNQSGIRFIFIPVAICAAFWIGKVKNIQASILFGCVSALALLANFETGIVATMGLGAAFLTRIHNQSIRMQISSILLALFTLLLVFSFFGLIYYYFFNAWPFPNDLKSVSSFFLIFNNGYGGLKLPLRCFVLLMVIHTGYCMIQFLKELFEKNSHLPEPMTIATAIIILGWLPYYINRPDDWNLWTFIALYSLFIMPKFSKEENSLLPFILSSLIVIPIAAKNLPYFVAEPIKARLWQVGFQSGCAGGLILPKEYCEHLETRANTLKNYSLKGSVVWSTALPVLTNQMYHTDSIYWLGSLFQKGLTTKDYNDVIEKIKEKKIDYLLFDDPNDLYIQPRQPENAFNNRIISSLNNEYCAPRLTNGWLIAERKLKNNCKL